MLNNRENDDDVGYVKKVGCEICHMWNDTMFIAVYVSVHRKKLVISSRYA